MRAIIITAFIDSNIFTDFPYKEGVMAIGIVEFRFRAFTESLFNLKKMVTDFASKLRPFFTVIVIDELMRGITDRTFYMNWDKLRRVTMFNR